MVKYAIPGMYEHFHLLTAFFNFKRDNPQCFYSNVDINAVYGNFQFCTWDGGRIFTSYIPAVKEDVEMVVNTYNQEFNYPVRFIFTNNQLKEEDCYDRFNNMVLETAHNEMNEVVVNSPILEKYIRENYPKYKIISSTTKCITSAEELKEELNNQDYYQVCLDYNFNRNFDLLSNLNIQEKLKTELLVNAICPPSCPNRKNHYRLNSLFSLNYGKHYSVQCNITHNNLYPGLNEKTVLSPEDILENYVLMGFSNFKLEGRTFDKITLLANLVKYMVKPEYHLYVMSQLGRE